MDSILVQGGGPLKGQIPIAGAKNACLTLMPATLLSEEPLTLTNAPRLSDIKTMTELLQSLGAEVATMQDGKTLAMSCHSEINTRAEYDIVRKMRASNLVLGPLLAREGVAVEDLQYVLMVIRGARQPEREVDCQPREEKTGIAKMLVFDSDGKL